ncbi:hypothetical protein ACFQWF_19360 [Methylorubrum suomiense]
MADRSIPAHDGASGREIPSLIRGVMAAIRRMSDAQGGALTTAGVGDAYTVTTGVGLTGLRAGLQFMVRANRDSVIAPTLRLDGLPAVDWLSAGADVPVVLRAGRIYSVVYDAASDVVRSIIPEMSVDASAPCAPSTISGRWAAVATRMPLSLRPSSIWPVPAGRSVSRAVASTGATPRS